MSYAEGDTLTADVDGDELTVTVERETADGLLLVTDGERRFTIGKGEVNERVSRTLTFAVYPDADGPFAVMNQERPDIPRGTLEAIQNHVHDAVQEGRLTVDGLIEEAGEVVYEPGKDDGEVLRVTVTAEA